MPHQASVVVSDIRKTMMVRLRVSGSANRSATVKRVSACSVAVSVAPLSLRARAARRLASTSSQTSDSSIEVLIQSVNSAGKMPMTNM